MLNNDPDISTDDILPAVLDAARFRNNELYNIPISFYLNTLVGRTLDLDHGVKTLNMNEFIAFNDRMAKQDRRLLSKDSGEMFFRHAIEAGLSDYVSYDDARCNFTDGSFKQFTLRIGESRCLITGIGTTF